MMKRILISTFVVVALTAIGSTTTAQQPVIFELEIPENVMLWDCGDYEIWDDAVLRIRVKEYYDQDGNFSKVLVHGWFTETMYNATTGESIEAGTNGYNFMETVRRPGSFIHHGLMYHATVPGVGRVLVDAGNFVMQDPWLYDDWRDSITWQKGNHQNIDGDYDKLCEVLR
jgi:hypothetical protein